MTNEWTHLMEGRLRERLAPQEDNGGTSTINVARYLAQFPSAREISGRIIFVKLTRVGLLTGALLLMLASAACTGGSSGSSYSSSSAPTVLPTTVSVSTSSSPASSGTQKQVAITARDYSFSAGTANVTANAVMIGTSSLLPRGNRRTSVILEYAPGDALSVKPSTAGDSEAAAAQSFRRGNAIRR
jgi:hypothetical protein